MAPPVRQSQSCGGAPAVSPVRTGPRCCLRRTRSHPRAGARRAPRRQPRAVSGPVGRSGRARLLDGGAVAVGVDRDGERFERADDVVASAREDMNLAALGHQVAGLAGIGEERDGRLGVDEHEVAQAVELDGGELGQVGEPVDRLSTSSPLEPGRERLAEQLGAGSAGDAAAAASAGSRHACPPTNSADGSPDRSAAAMASTVSLSTGARARPEASMTPGWRLRSTRRRPAG